MSAPANANTIVCMIRYCLLVISNEKVLQRLSLCFGGFVSLNQILILYFSLTNNTEFSIYVRFGSFIHDQGPAIYIFTLRWAYKGIIS